MTPPVYSIVVPLYNTEKYLPALLDSLQRQQGLGSAFRLECLFIDDSSPDDAAGMARDWLRDTAIAGRVITQPNRGVSAARNRGLDEASGEWIAFIDSDDFLSEHYVLGVHRFLQTLGDDSGAVSLVSCNVARYFEEDGRYDHAHALRDKFNRGDQLYALEQHPEFIQSQAASAFFPLERLRASGVRFLEGLHVAEDALFVASYLLKQHPPMIACVASSDYFYRQRASQDSAVNQFSRNPDFYFGRFRRGYLPLFESNVRENAKTPRWLGQYLLYDLRWFFPRERQDSTKATHLSADERAEVLRLVMELLQYVEATWIRDYSITGMDLELRDLLLALKGAQLLTDGLVEVHRVDEPRQLVQLRYRFVGDVPDEHVTVGDVPATVLARKTRNLDFFGQERMRERILWVKAEDDLAVHLDGRQQRITVSPPSIPAFSVSRARLGFDRYEDPAGPPIPAKAERPLLRRFVGRVRREIAAAAPGRFRSDRLKALGRELSEPRVAAITRIHAQRPAVRARVQNAWLFMDGVDDADGDAEAVYWHVREAAPEVNAFFVLRQGSEDWKRLKHAGARLIAYDSLAHRAALMHADFVIASRIGSADAAPLPAQTYWDGRTPWRFVFLHDDTIAPDSSFWAQEQEIALVTTMSEAGWHCLVDDGTTSPFTSLDAKPTGLPRHDADRLRSARRARPDRERLVLAPRELDEHWRELIQDPRLRKLVAQRGAQLDVLSPSVGASAMSASVLVTDRPSLALDALVAGAAVGRFRHPEPCPVGQRETDRSRLGELGHAPSAVGVDATVELITRLLAAELSGPLMSPHREWADSLHPRADGTAAARVLEAIRSLG